MLSRTLAIKLISFQFKSFIRNERWRRSVLSKLIAGITLLLMVSASFFIGRYIKELLSEAGGEPVGVFNSVLLWYFSADLIQRSALQPLPTLGVVPFLRLPVKRQQLMHWLIFRSLWNVFNLLPLLIVVPFIARVLVPGHGGRAGVAYFFGIILWVLLNNFLAVLIGFLSKRNLLCLLIPAGIFAGLYFSSYLHFSVWSVSRTAGQFLISGDPLFFLLLSGAIVVVIKVTQMVLAPRFYIDQMTPSGNRHFTARIVGLDDLTAAGEIKRNIWLELNLILRNKRPRQLLGPPSLILMAYLTYITVTDKSIHPLFHLLIIVLVTGLLPAQYGQFLFSWESSGFDGIMARKNDLNRYVRSKYYLMVIMAIAGFIPFCLCVSLFSNADVLLLFSLFFFTIGVTCFIILFTGTFNDARIVLDRTQYFSYQAVRGSQFVLTLAFTLIPMGLYELFQFFFGTMAGEMAVAIPGVLFLLFHGRLIQWIIVPQLRKRKYKNLEGYRKLSI